MTGPAAIIIIIFAIVLVIVCSILGNYNTLVNAQNKIYNQFTEIDKQIKNKLKLLSQEEYNQIVKKDYKEMTIEEKIKLNKKITSSDEKIDKYNEKITYAKEFYNETVNKYNDLLDTFPTIIVAKLFKFNKHDLIK